MKLNLFNVLSISIAVNNIQLKIHLGFIIISLTLFLYELPKLFILSKLIGFYGSENNIFSIILLWK